MGISSIFKIFAGRSHRKFVKKCKPIVAKINKLEVEFQKLSEDSLKAKTQEFKERIKKGESLDKILPEAFAVVKNAARRLCGQKIIVCDHEIEWDMVHFDVQLIGGIALHQNKIAEMATGEGKTLVATLPLYLNALTGRNCQLVTVNDYLARRDSEWMGYLFKYLGLTVGCIQNSMYPAARREAYSCDITYGTASEFGFDYLRDNGMAGSVAEQVQSDHYYCIVDEIDSILIDEARTPLIISGPVNDDHEPPFTQFKPGVAALVEKQTRLCNKLVERAKKLLEKAKPGSEAEQEALIALLQVKLGAPRNKQFLKMMENGTWRKALDSFDSELMNTFNRERRFNIKEELYYAIDERRRESDLTQRGRDTLRPDNPDAFVLPDLPSQFIAIDAREDLDADGRAKLKSEAETNFITVSETIHCISQLLRAYALFEKDVQYVIKDGKVMIVDENTGRIMPGRRWSDGLHQAIEAKEGVEIEKETKTYATITIQNYFRMYEKLAGMTGTAETEAGEFYDIYRLGVVAIPTNKPCIRIDDDDMIFKTRREKYAEAVKEISEAHAKGQPVLVGTASVEASELLSRSLNYAGIPHNVLNAKNHEIEAEIVANAGQRGAVTIATNMAGRGTDIKLGEGVRELGGLFVLGTERHESRRVDRQLRGRCSRQGDPGRSKFLISLEDDLMRLFTNAGMISKVLQRSFVEGQPLQHPILNRSVETAQRRVEGVHFMYRKNTLQYDDVFNKQREIIYGLRNQALRTDKPRDLLFALCEEEINERVDAAVPENEVGEINKVAVEDFVRWLNSTFPVHFTEEEILGAGESGAAKLILGRVREAYEKRDNIEDAEALKNMERHIILRAIDTNWQDHLAEMADLRQSIGLRSYGQRNPLVEYKNEAFSCFKTMLGRFRSAVCTGIFRSATSMDAFQKLMAELRGIIKEPPHNNADGQQEVAIDVNALKRIMAQSAAQKNPEPVPVPEDILRNDLVVVGKGEERVVVKWKKAREMIESEGWVFLGRSRAIVAG
ncbi:MAG: preprotein translocase subunit SecA [Opitutae bacterium]|nr:preprotein translocase subunit SecA [Opitutae bacterium]MCD8299494.1 preprotein translocase subunit SecA [Opitutae bacterium]